MTHLQAKERQVIALTWGSTWGHTFPLAALHNYLQEENEYDFVWVWEEEGLEEEIAHKHKIKFLDIPAGKIRRYFDIRNFYEPLKNLTGLFYGIYYILKYKIDIVFSKWWYVSLPLCIAAFLLRKKIYIHESDTFGWVANKIIAKVATKVFYTFPNEHIDGSKHIVTGQILNPELIENLKDLYIGQNDKLSVYVIGGSQWSKTIFSALLKALPDLQDIEFQIVLGEKNMDFRSDFKRFDNVLVHDFLTQKRMWTILKKIDIAVTRAWATSLRELNMFGIHSIIIPLGNSAWDHQNKNAWYFHENFWSDLLDEEDNLSENLKKKLLQYRDLRKQWLNLKNFYRSLEIIEKELKHPAHEEEKKEDNL